MVKLLKTLTLLAAALFSATAWSQYAQYTVATLPNPIGYPPTVTVQATDGANAQDCKVGGGNYTVNCNAFRGQWLPSISGSGNPGGSTGQAQYNNAGAFGGSPFTLDASGNATVPAGTGLIGRMALSCPSKSGAV